ncbi:hypothetical protein ABZS96_17375 [Streptomyces avermitilis]|uniref:hypothetical protein n=1 Tax=Streptomyces avermitilis TaxID=33903 RepID=UPI0033A5FC94
MATRVEQVGQALPERRPELDALRMLVVFGLIFFHSALVFATDDDYYVKNSATTSVVGNLAASLEQLGDDVDTLSYWDQGHGANTDAADFIAWIAKVTGYKK